MSGSRRRPLIALVGCIIAVGVEAISSEADASSITFRGATSGWNASGATLSLDRPIEALAGDVLVASVDVLGAVSISKPSGWVVARTTSNGTAMKQATYYRLVSTSEPSNYTWTFSKAKPATGGILAYGGIDTTSPIEASSGSANVSSTTIIAPSIDVSDGGTLVVGLFGVRAGTTMTPPNGMLERFDIASGTRITSEAADVVQAAPGATGDKVATAAVANLGIGQLVALRPASSTAPSMPPTALAGSAQTFEATPAVVTMKATDPEQCQLIFQIASDPANGTLGTIDPRACKVSKTGGPNTDIATITYTPEEGFTGSDAFTFHASDGTSLSNTATITVTVKPLPPGVAPVLETAPPVGSEDIADDPAIWIHPTDPSLSLVVATSKSPTEGGVYVYDLAGTELQRIESGASNNVDLRYGFSLGGEDVDLVAVSNKSTNSIDFYVIDPNTRRLSPAGSAATTSLAETGLCMYRSALSGTYYVITARSSGQIRQYELSESAGTIAAAPVRNFDAGGASEGCVADDELGSLYVSEETRALWRYGAEPGDGSVRVGVDTVGLAGHLVADVEGVSIYDANAGKGYLVVSCQGESTFAVYRREGTNDFVGKFRIIDGNGVDGVEGTDGLDVSNVALGSSFPEGMLAVHDHKNVGGSASNYKFIRWDAVAAAVGLSVDTTHDPRAGTHI